MSWINNNITTDQLKKITINQLKENENNSSIKTNKLKIKNENTPLFQVASCS